MSVHEHRSSAPGGPASIQVVVVSSTRTLDDDESGKLIERLVRAAGHKVNGRQIVPDDRGQIQSAVQAHGRSGLVDVVILTGGTGISARDVTPEAIRELLDVEVEGFGELFRHLSYTEIGSAAMLSRATAGLMGPLVVFALPGSAAACELAVEKLVLPELGHLRSEVRKEAPVAEEAVEDVEDVEAEVIEEEEPAGPPPPSGSLGRLGHGAVAVSGTPIMAEPPAAAEGEGEELPEGGWKRAIYEVSGEVLRGKWPDLPEEVEKHAPVMNVLETAGEHAVLKLPSGAKLTLYGWPDLQRPSSKVLAVGWGDPYAEIIALHRYPTLTGLCIEDDWAQLPKRDADIERICETVTGRAPRDTSGELFALQGDAVWIQRGHKVIRWDGKKEHDDGTPKQVIATLVLRWSGR